MTNEEIYALLDRFEHSTLHTLKLSRQDFSLELTRGNPASAPELTAAAPVVFSAAAEAPAITAPLVGTYYAASAPDQAPYAAVGQTVKKGQTVCLIEAMKMMSEVCAPCDCVISECLAANGTLVAFGQPLFRYQPC